MTVSTKQGIFTVWLGPVDSIGRSLYCAREFELNLISETMALLRSLHKCPPRGQGTLVDVGANNGVISIGMIHTGEMRRAIAIEPEPKNFVLLERNVKQNNLAADVFCVRSAVSDRRGELVFELSSSDYGDHRVRNSPEALMPGLYEEAARRTTTVPCEKLDALIANAPKSFSDDIAVVWLDVQGYEGYVFLGAMNLLSTGVSVISEIWPYGIRRSGMAAEYFCELAARIWSHYWVKRQRGFIKYPIAMLPTLLDEVGYGGSYTNVVFTV